MADVVDVSYLSRDLVKTIDFRLFVAIFCGLDISVPLSNCSWCGEIVNYFLKRKKSTPLSHRFSGTPMDKCGHLLGNLWKEGEGEGEREGEAEGKGEGERGGDGEGEEEREGEGEREGVGEKEIEGEGEEGREGEGERGRDVEGEGYKWPLVSRLRSDCSNMIWTYGRDSNGNLTDYFRSGKLNGICPNFSPGILPEFEHEYILTGLEIMKRDGRKIPIPKNVVSYLGTKGTRFAESKILSIGSAMHYYDFEALDGDEKVGNLSCQTSFLPFTRPIMRAAKKISETETFSNGSFVCLHYRGGDGQFSDPLAQNATNKIIIDQLDSLYEGLKSETRQNVSLFIMTDLRTNNWRKRLSEIFGRSGYIPHFPIEFLFYDLKVRERVLSKRYGLFTNRLSTEEIKTLISLKSPVKSNGELLNVNQTTFAKELRGMSLYMEQALCSCASMGFIPNHGSTISQNIHHLRNGGLCSRDYEAWKTWSDS